MKYEATVSVDHSSVAWGAEAMGALGSGPHNYKGLPTSTNNSFRSKFLENIRQHLANFSHLISRWRLFPEYIVLPRKMNYSTKINVSIIDEYSVLIGITYGAYIIYYIHLKSKGVCYATPQSARHCLRLVLTFEVSTI